MAFFFIISQSNEASDPNLADSLILLTYPHKLANQRIEPMKIKFSNGWKYIFREISIVVIGVLVAFILNSWWMNAKEARSKKVMLKNLTEEFVSNNQELEQTITIDEFVLRNTEALEQLLQKVPANEPVMVPDTILTGVIIAATYNPASGNINSFLNANDQKGIADNELVASVASWSNAYYDAAEDEQTGFNFIETQFLPYLRQQTDLTEILGNAGLWARYARTRTMDARLSSNFIEGTVTINANLKLRNLIAQRKLRLGIIIGALRRLQENQDYTLSLIERNKP